MVVSGMILGLSAAAGDAGPMDTAGRSLADLSIEQLMNESVTSVSKKETRLADSPAAITVITAEDIRRIGATTIPEALRIVPGLEVARINASEWAVSSRGFNSQYASKLLVLVDGRSVYTPSFSGVFWHMQDLMLEDLDRIEVIRGPGATLWGANAVNGVINITTKSARDTQGFLANVTYGTEWEPLVNMRYGAQIGSNLYYRVYGQYLDHDNFARSDGTATEDQWRSYRAGLRLDWHPSEENHFTFQGDYNQQQIHQPFNEARLAPIAGVFAETAVSHNYSANVLGRWTHTFSPSSESSLQFYYDTFSHTAAESTEIRNTFDIDWQHRFAVGSRNDLVWGLGYRYTPDNISPASIITFTPQRSHHQLLNLFAQDEIQLIPDRLSLTLGSKLEHNDYTGWELQPSGRLLWKVTQQQTAWAAVSRATRTPNRFEADSRANLAAFQPPLSPPVEVSYLAASKLRSEELTAYELGYRIEPTPRLSFDVATFYHSYQHLESVSGASTNFESTPGPPHVLLSQQWRFANSGETHGIELQSQWHPTDWWRLTGSYTWLYVRLHPSETADQDNPQHQFNLRSYVDITKNLEFNAAAYYVAQTSHSSDRLYVTPSYVRLDLGVTWRPTKNLELSIWGQNLLDNRHSEFVSYHSSFLTETPRSVFGKISVRF
ncbi:MAG: iron complex outerrane recepter protein [Verrucomicrobiota bacterium]